MAILNLGVDLGIGTSAGGGSGNLLSVDLTPLASLNIGAGASTLLTVGASVGGSATTPASPIIDLGIDLGTGTTGGAGGLLGGLLGGGSAGGGDGLVPATTGALIDIITGLTGSLTGGGGTPSNPGSQGQLIVGTEGNDVLRGTGGNDTINALAGNDVIVGGAGNDMINGGAGRDTVVLSGTMAQFTAAAQGGVIGFQNTTTGEIDFLTSVERIGFSDHVLALDFNGNAGQAFRLYQSEFNRRPDTPGLTHNVQLLDSGAISLHDMASAFVNSAEAQQRYGSNTTNGTFVTNLYLNTLHREPDAAGFQNWVNALNNGVLDRGSVLLGFSESAENHNNTDHQLQNGILLDYAVM